MKIKNNFYIFTIIFSMIIGLLFATQQVAQAQTTLGTGDIVIVGFNFDNPDEFAFMLLADVTAGTEIKFTDNGWLQAGGFRGGEGVVTWTASQALPSGTVISPTVAGNTTGSFALSGSGDQLLAYQGDEATPTFLYALNSEGLGIWQADATSSNTSALPTGLTNGTTAVALNEIDNAVYNMTVTGGNVANIQAAVGNTANWSGSNTATQTMPTYANIAIQESFYVGGATQDYIILQNYGLDTIDITGWRLCSQINYSSGLSAADVVVGSLLLAPGERVQVRSWRDLNNAADLGLYLPSGGFGTTTAMVDFVQWGSSGNGRESVANNKGIWITGTFVPTADDTPLARPIEAAIYDGSNSGVAQQSQVSDFNNSTPTNIALSETGFTASQYSFVGLLAIFLALGLVTATTLNKRKQDAI